ncbi:MAG: tetraspanin family protein [Candidatus Thermoplasmatota archaeon]|nr:tetraspanin family protein [Candidatus Thermoplasmatota archaeon]
MKGKTTCPQCNHEFVMDVPEDSETHTIKCPQCNHLFVIKRTCQEEPDDECGWEEYGEPRKTILSSMKKKTNKPIIASFLLLATGILGIFTAVILASSNGPIIPQLEFVASYFSNNGNIVFSAVLVIFSAFAFAGSITAFKRRYFIFTAICAVVGIFSVGLFIGFVLSIVALALLIIYRDEFENAAKGKVF